MTRLVVHIGLEKTGSTYLQEFLQANVAQLAAEGVAYPDFCAGPEHLEVYMAALPKVGWMHRRKGIQTAEQLCELTDRVHEGLERMARAPGEVAIVSCERLATWRRATAIGGLRDLCSTHFDEVEVVAFLRRPDHSVGSYYGQAVKVGFDSRSAPDFMRAYGPVVDQVSVMRRWAAVFGADRVTAWPYLERYRTAGDEVLGVLLNRLGATSPGPGDPGAWRPSAPSVNARLSAVATEYVRLLNPRVPRWKPNGAWNGKQRERLVRAASARFPGRSATASPELVAAVRAEFPAAEIAAMWRREDDPDAPLWEEWIGQAPATGHEPPAITQAQADAFYDEVFPSKASAGGSLRTATGARGRRRLLERIRSRTRITG